MRTKNGLNSIERKASDRFVVVLGHGSFACLNPFALRYVCVCVRATKRVLMQFMLRHLQI